jgi:predicted nucleic acid-binding protein
MKVLIDTNVLLDFLLEREAFKKDAEELFATIDSEQIIGYASIKL